MAERRERFKEKRLGFANVEQSRVLRANRQESQRHEERALKFSKHRVLVTDEHVASSSSQNDPKQERLKKLEEWKKQREVQKKLQQKEKKPAFKVGIYHPPLCPITSTNTLSSKHLKNDTTLPVKGITKATEKRLAAKAAKVSNVENVLPKSRASSNISIKSSVASKIKSTRNSVAEKVVPKTSNKKSKSTAENTLNETFEIEPQKDDEEKLIEDEAEIEAAENMRNTTNKDDFQTKKDLLTSLIAPVSKIEESTNITATASFFITEDRTSTPNTSIEPVTLQVTPKNNECNANTTKFKVSDMENNLMMETAVLQNSADTSLNRSQKPAFFSPYVVCSRGKKNARKEQELRRGFGRLTPEEDNIPTKETVMKNLNISIEEEERTAQYFKFLVDRETERLNEICDKWSKIMMDEEVGEDGKYMINQAIGQTRLLLGKKIQRFRNLVEDCECGKGERLVTCKDLQGFWDMTHIEIDNCDERFKKLEKMKNKNWIEEQEKEEELKMAEKVQKRVKKRKATSPGKQPEKKLRTGGIREHILAAKKKKKALQGHKDNILDIVIVDKKEKNKEQSFTFIRRSSTPKIKPDLQQKKTSSSKDLLKKAVSRLKKDSPLTLMKVSKMFKTPEIQLDHSISYINSSQTPGKGILKRIEENVVEGDSHSRKSTHKVNFNDTVIENEIPADKEQAQTKNLAEALARIDSYDNDTPDDEYEVRAERKLNFEESTEDEDQVVTVFDEINKSCVDKDKSYYGHEEEELPHKESPSSPALSSSVSDSIFDSRKRVVKKVVPKIKITSATPKRKSRSRRSNFADELNSTVLQDTDEKKDSDEEHIFTRTLRNRTVTTPLTPTSRKRKSLKSQQEDEAHVNISFTVEPKSPLTIVKSALKLNTTVDGTETKYMKTPKSNNKRRKTIIFVNKEESVVEEVPLMKKRSVRKSVRFDEDGCMACTPQKKSQIPVTPIPRRSLKKITFDEGDSED